MKTGKIIKSIAGFYEVHTGDALYRCRARGVFRALGVKPLVGDNVSMEVTDTYGSWRLWPHFGQTKPPSWA